MNETKCERLFKMAIQKKHAGKLKEALEYLEELLSMPESDRQDVLMEKAHILYRLGNFEECIECVDQCRMLNDIDFDPSTAHLPRGSAWIDGDDAVAEIDPEALLLKSLALDRLGKTKEAEGCREESAMAATKLFPIGHANDWWAIHASAYCKRGWWERAAFCQDAQVQIDPDKLNAPHENASRPSNMGKCAESLPFFDNAIERGTVDQTGEVIAISYGEEDIPVALIAKDEKGQFVVQFLLSETTEDPEIRKILKSVYRELDFYLVKKNEKDPWAYAKYHCGSAANMYSKVHWSYQCKP